MICPPPPPRNAAAKNYKTTTPLNPDDIPGLLRKWAKEKKGWKDFPRMVEIKPINNSAEPSGLDPHSWADSVLDYTFGAESPVVVAPPPQPQFTARAKRMGDSDNGQGTKFYRTGHSSGLF